MARNIGDYLFQYLDAKQHLWNAYFRKYFTDLGEAEPLDSFEEIDNRLFYILVSRTLNLTLPRDFFVGSAPIGEIVIKPISAEIVLMVERPSNDRNRYWTEGQLAKAAGLAVDFIDFFQWNAYDFLSCSMVRGVVRACPHKPEWVGLQALLEIRAVNFFLRKQASGKRAAKKAPQSA